MSNTSVLMVRSIGAIRPFSDFVAASVLFSASITFTGKVPEKRGQPFGIDTELELTARSFVHLRESDTATFPNGISENPLSTKTKKLTLNSATTLSALNQPVAGTSEMFLPDNLSETQDASAPPMEPTLNFGDSKMFNEYVLSGISPNVRNDLIGAVKNMEMFFAAEDEIATLRNGTATVGDDGVATNANAGRLAELERVVASQREKHVQRRQGLLAFMSRNYLVLTANGFVVTRPDYEKPGGKGPGDKKVLVPAIPADEYLPEGFVSVVRSFIEEHVSNNASRLVPEVEKFVSQSFDELASAVSVQ